jgi:excisionase family DNA binding protein
VSEAFVTIAQAAEINGRTSRDIHRLITEGKLPATRVGNAWRIALSDLRELRPPKTTGEGMGLAGKTVPSPTSAPPRFQTAIDQIVARCHDGAITPDEAIHDVMTCTQGAVE